MLFADELVDARCFALTGPLVIQPGEYKTAYLEDLS